MSSFVVNIVTPSGVVYDHEAKFLVANTTNGSLGVLPNHAPLIAPLKIDAIRIDLSDTEGNKSDWVAVNGGIIEIRDNVVSVLANSAETEESIDVTRAEMAKKRAEEKIALAKERKDESIDMDRAEVALHRAINRLNVANKRK
ncbi:F0F1 ATP synthase subunit epsilon [Vagococcus penaei]|uniref:ATP synthase epsilon chain n=1 Tax=Vagococcus penaei TaxID=633807 RepID=A0A1Q2D4V7_9ENTE|nr:F0F1 ATP synthase subunit epsilon [Vagococcus penaei]AQP53315.1 F0F1 ATP synthase subunit epsilon [Vagococcus penaei]RSU04085.1 F0F1 ATP synthase subunit epsilon [Vagococcus penaei]